MTQTTKRLHIARGRVSGWFAPVALCGRRVNRLRLTDDTEATCKTCLKNSAEYKAQVIAALEAAHAEAIEINEDTDRCYPVNLPFRATENK